ncbi:MAG: T9SS type A sorting domain-containing protein [Candidatus Eisenbacteria bacterium]|uniref:T9SS type A sorting domain-containing protein n=1 Tax=Eiseniibacteriota bacterium TaxID=2212470 RepID=A0A956RPP6_UNCEI|nr:T9SS type A sorting domain-containing protein [Candidatus Eisenbacteria bacterium]
MDRMFVAGLLGFACAGITASASQAAPQDVAPHFELQLNAIGEYRTGVFDDGGSEIVAYDPFTRRVFSTNGSQDAVDVIDLHDPAHPELLFSIDLTPYGAGPTSTAVQHGLLAVAVPANVKTDPGTVVFFRSFGSCEFVNQVQVGALPDMVTFTEKGLYVLVANEAEPNDDYDVDPEGSISVIDLRRGADRASVATADFHAYDGHEDELRARGIRIFGPGASASQDLEPEYITVSQDSRTAWVTLQENDAIAVVDIRSATVRELLPLGYKDHSLPGQGLDPSNRDDGIEIANWPVWGMYQPDAIASFRSRGHTYLVTANEGDSRDYDGYSEEARIGSLDLDPSAFPDAADLQDNAHLGRLNSTTALGDDDGDGDYDRLFCYGARSFSIWDENGNQVFDSGDQLEQITAALSPDDFNSNNDENDSFDSRSDDKGPEPEGVTIGRIWGRTYAFIGLERIGGVMVFDVTNPHAPDFVQYVNTRNFAGDPEADTAGDLGPEGLVFVPALASPTFRPLLLVSNEVSGSIAVFEISLEHEHGHHGDHDDAPLTEELPNLESAPGGEPTPAGSALTFQLGQNHPNPFRPESRIGYSLPSESHVTLTVIDVTGREVLQLVNETQAAGAHEARIDGNELPSGTYFYRLQAGGNTAVRRMIVLD